MSDQLRHRIQQWEASPPPEAWANIAVALHDINAENAVADRLQQFEVAPPPANWPAIQQEIQHPATPKTPVIPLQPLYPYLFRYGAVAIGIGVLAWVLMGNPFWKNSSGEGNEVQVLAEPQKNKPLDSNLSIATAITGGKPRMEEPATPETTMEPAPREPRYAFVHRQKVSPAPMGRVESPKLPGNGMQELPVQKRNQRYITIYSASGEPIRLSAKFAPLYYAMMQETENNNGNPAAVLLQQMQQQMSRQPYIPDPNNHFDMIRLVDLLQQ